MGEKVRKLFRVRNFGKRISPSRRSRRKVNKKCLGVSLPELRNKNKLIRKCHFRRKIYLISFGDGARRTRRIKAFQLIRYLKFETVNRLQVKKYKAYRPMKNGGNTSAGAGDPRKEKTRPRGPSCDSSTKTTASTEAEASESRKGGSRGRPSCPAEDRRADTHATKESEPAVRGRSSFEASPFLFRSTRRLRRKTPVSRCFGIDRRLIAVPLVPAWIFLIRMPLSA